MNKESDFEKDMKNYDREKNLKELELAITKCAMFRKLTKESLEKLKKTYEINKDPKIKAFIEETEEWLKFTEGTPEIEDFPADKKILSGN